MNKLVVKQTFGLNSQSLSTCMCFAEDHQLAYVAGHQVVVLNTETKEQNFINISNQQQQNYLSTGTFILQYLNSSAKSHSFIYSHRYICYCRIVA